MQGKKRRIEGRHVLLLFIILGILVCVILLKFPNVKKRIICNCAKEKVVEIPNKPSVKIETSQSMLTTAFDVFFVDEEGRPEHAAYYALDTMSFATGDPDGKGFYRVKYFVTDAFGIKTGIKLRLNQEDKILKIVLDPKNDFVDEYEYDCVSENEDDGDDEDDDEDDLFCQLMEEEVVYWRAIINWHYRIEQMREEFKRSMNVQ